MQFLTTLQTILTFALMFTFLVFFHELGHFSAAKWLKMVVEEFAFGLPIPGTKRWFRFGFDGQTEYTVWPVLAGGFVRIKGMEIEDFGGDTSENNKPTEDRQSLPFPTTSATLLEQESQEVSGADPDGFNNRPIRHRFAVIAAGPLFSFLFGWLVLCSIGMLVGLPDGSHARLGIGEVQKNSAAAQAGLKNGDTILSINNKSVEFEEGLKIIQTSANKPLALSVRGDGGDTRTVTATPREEPAEDGKTVGRLGFAPNMEDLTTRRVGPVESFRLGTDLTKLWFTSIVKIVRSGEVKETLGGPVRIYKETQKASKRGAGDTLALVGQLSLSLGLFNLLPIPVLDGGYLLLMGVEFVRGGKKLTGEQTARVLTGGFIFLALMTVVILFKDIFGR